MALNNYMHPRNIYKTPPDFSKLALAYPDFANIYKMDLSGKYTINFKDPHCLRILTKCLLKSDFNLDIEIPEDRLVPTLPLRLNYILWVEDLLNSIDRTDNVWGIDIGTGACAIYPILAAVKNKWNMIGTETDEESLKKAQQNINKNNLLDFVKLSKNPTDDVIQYLLNDVVGQVFDFCMCNPPFYCNYEELSESRNPSRHPPKNAFTGSPQELITEGGELVFCRKLINESKLYKDRVIIFTTMVGHKYNLMELLQDLTADGIKSTHTEFCQGRVTRWGVAWTYQPHDIGKLVPSRNKLRKKKSLITYNLPQLPNNPYDVKTCTEKIKTILNELNIENKIVNKRENSVSLHISALSNTWSHQRRKRRLMKILEKQEAKKLKIDSEAPSLSLNNSEEGEIISFTHTESNNTNDSSDNNNKKNLGTSDVTDSNTISVSKDPIVQAFIKVYKKDKLILFEMEYLSGNAGKEGLHQIVQYIKNNWK